MCRPIGGSRGRIHVLVAAVTISMVVSLSAGQSGSSDERVRRATEHFLTVFQNFDWDAFRLTWSKDPTVFFPFVDTPERVTGTAAVEARWRRFFDDGRRQGGAPPYFQVTPRNLLVQRHGDTAVVTFDLGESPNPRRGRRTLIFVKEKDAWKLAHLHASVIVSP
jgi:ketosteroid isomerase-like protein